MRHDHNCGCSRCYDLNYGSSSLEDLEAAATIYDNVLAGTHEQTQAEAVRWLKDFKNPNDQKHWSKRYQTYVERM